MVIDFSPPHTTVASPVQGVSHVSVVSGGVKSPQKHSVPRTDEIVDDAEKYFHRSWEITFRCYN